MPTKDANHIATNWIPNVVKTNDIKLPAMTGTAKTLIAEHKISDENVAKIPCTGKDGKLTKADVDAFVANVEEVDETENVATLIFEQSGWCEKLNRSYYKGPYKPSTKAEYDALKPFAANG